MRKVKILNAAVDEIVKLMLLEEKDGVYLFLYSTADDKPCDVDVWFDSVGDAEKYVSEYYGMTSDWSIIHDQLEGCQQDMIEPIRVKGRDIGKPEWGRYEKLIDGKWAEYTL